MSIQWKAIDFHTGDSTTPELFFFRPCPICGAVNAKTVLEFKNFQFFSDSSVSSKRVPVRVNQCHECFALYLNPCYSAYGFSILFAEAGQSYGSSEGRPLEQVDWLKAQGLLTANSRFLDVGCYDGQFLARLPKDIKKVGIDIDEQAITRGRKKDSEKQIDFILGDFDKFLYEKPIDTISMFHVLEHLPSPLGVLRNLRKIAQSSTQLVVEVPILENGITNDINGFFSVQHMTHFSRRSLTNCLLRSGWKIEEWLEQPDYNGCRVLAVPHETVKNISGNNKDIGSLYHYLAAWYTALEDVNRKLNQTEKKPKCVIWGAGLHTEFLYQLTSLFHNSSTEYAIIDSDPLKQGKSWRGIHIYHPETLSTVDWPNALLVISSYGSQNIIAESCITSGVPKERVVRLYDNLRVY